MVKALMLLQMELKEKFRYKIEVFSAATDAIMMVVPAIAIMLFGEFHIEGIHSRFEYMQYMIFSLIIWQAVENMWSAVFEIRRKMKEGNFEYMMNLPLKGMHYIFGWAVGGVISMITEMIPLIVLFVIFCLPMLSIDVILKIVGIVIVMMVGTYGFAEILMGLSIYFREADQFISLVANAAPFIAGLYFPISQLPSVFLYIGCIFPFTWGLDLLRNVLFGSQLVLPLQIEVIVFIGICIVYAIFGSMIYDALIYQARKNSLVKF